MSSVTSLHHWRSEMPSNMMFKIFSKVRGMARITSHMARSVLQAQNTLSVRLPQPQGHKLGQPQRTQAVLQPL